MIVIDLGVPPAKPMSINEERSGHWRAARAHSKAWRELAWAVALHTHLAALVAQAPATVTVEIPVKGNYRRDPANYFGVAKAVIDGLVDAGVWPDDTPQWVAVAEPTLVVGGDVARIHLDLRETS